MKPLISVIVPIYNVENYLRTCIDSIISQSYENLEIILVDDGSKDNCGKICDEYAVKDSRIIVIHKDNGGLSSARNAGIDICKGEFISFIDSDDFVSDYFIELLYEGIKKYSADIVSCTKGTSFIDGEELPNLNGEKNYSLISITPFEALKQMMYQRIPNGAQFRLYRRSIFEVIRFPVGYLFEDVATIHKTFMCANEMVLLSADIYGYRVRENSIVRQKFSDRKKIALKITCDLYKEICEYDIRLKKAVASRAFAQNFHVYLQIPFEDVKTRREFWNEIKKYRLKVLTDTCGLVRKKNRTGALVSLLGPSAAYKIGQIFIDRKG
ncbi:glycosyltransferase family 2 protein [Clostridium butyricum]|uniref:glycosyltransferase family 2 protein n=1 Tax=Clostridium butyricum TaxID=1492 RepID=UPI003D33FC30